MIFEETQRQWIAHALDQIYSGKLSEVQVAKTLRIISQIFEQRAQKIEMSLIDRFDQHMERNYQDIQNQKLIDILSN